MSVKDIQLELPGDKQAVINRMNELGLEYKKIGGSLWIKNTHIYVAERLCLYSDFAKPNEGKPIRGPQGYGEREMVFKDQERIYDALKRAILKYRKDYFRSVEEKIEEEREQQRHKLEKIKRVVNVEENILGEEHNLESQLKNTMALILKLRSYLPQTIYELRYRGFDIRHDKFYSKKHYDQLMKKFKWIPTPSEMRSLKRRIISQSIEGRIKGKSGFVFVDGGFTSMHIAILNTILLELKKEKIKAIYIRNKLSPTIQIEQVDGELKNQKKQLDFLRSQLRTFVESCKYFVKDLRMIPVSTQMRKYFKENYDKIIEIYEWYILLLKKEIKILDSS